MVPYGREMTLYELSFAVSLRSSFQHDIGSYFSLIPPSL